jgi:hypothetical protein
MSSAVVTQTPSCPTDVAQCLLKMLGRVRTADIARVPTNFSDAVDGVPVVDPSGRENANPVPGAKSRSTGDPGKVRPRPLLSRLGRQKMPEGRARARPRDPARRTASLVPPAFGNPARRKQLRARHYSELRRSPHRCAGKPTDRRSVGAPHCRIEPHSGVD